MEGGFTKESFGTHLLDAPYCGSHTVLLGFKALNWAGSSSPRFHIWKGDCCERCTASNSYWLLRACMPGCVELCPSDKCEAHASLLSSFGASKLWCAALVNAKLRSTAS